MKHSTSGRRSRGRGNGNGSRRSNHNRSQIFDSNGPDVRIRGTAHQIHEKYMALAKDAASSGDRIMEENYLQHAEHYQRIINSWEEEGQENRRRTQERKSQNTDDSIGNKVEDEDLSLPGSILTPAPSVQKELEDA